MSANTDCDLPTQNLQNIALATGTCDSPRAGIFFKYLRPLCGLAFLALSASLVAQTHFCIGGDLDHLSAAGVAACEAKIPGVRNAVKQNGAPADWHFVVVCDEAGWKEYVSFSGQETGLLSGASYSTDPQLHWTFLRGSNLNVEQPQTTATVVTMALNSVPIQKSAPQLPASGKTTRQYGVAMAKRGSSRVISQ